ncbi:lytic polysaccharide monooxygenase [Pseudomonas fontis]|uniref:Lytic polysaccharide monooxygenase n=1 Tax=Pseudomonas fontis TaxID=2942633 RepID=A0ABT5NQ48_9PSED|nr:lytic polysaccharide monooxygenase [Pseudomonas fontis]MDD0972836.1 lytic polysaccharide monooxygenase [Pseudomonas fontis]MDD0990293.1 lytic polysaccharide monooxygenase [Pseudomonas fontis]
MRSRGGDIAFTWFYEAPHATADWKYYITKQGWNPNEVLSRAQFETAPFCEVAGNGKISREGGRGAGAAHACTLPADRTGHHVIMGVWDVQDTSNSFHSMIDVDIEGAGVPPADGFKPVAAIAPNGDLKVGDKVRTRMFDAGGRSLSQFDTEITIENAQDMLADVWGKKLALAINASQKLIKAGVRNADQEIVPQAGRNELFVQAESGVANMQLAIDRAVALPPEVQVNGLQGEYKVKADEVTHIDFKVQGQDKLLVAASLYDAGNTLVGDDTREGASAGETLSMDIAVPGAMAKAGEYTLMLSASIPGKPEAGITQVSKAVKMIEAPEGGGEYDFVYPEGIDNYQEGTRVLAADGKIYAAKPFPFLGWAKQNNIAYKPGTGSAWAQAWDLVE